MSPKTYTGILRIHNGVFTLIPLRRDHNNETHILHICRFVQQREPPQLPLLNDNIKKFFELRVI